MGNWGSFTQYISAIMGPYLELVFGPTFVENTSAHSPPLENVELWKIAHGNLTIGSP